MFISFSSVWCSELCLMFVLKSALLFFVIWETIGSRLVFEPHSTSWTEKMTLKGDRGTPGFFCGLWQWCLRKKKGEKKKKAVPSLKVTVPGPPCTLPGGTTLLSSWRPVRLDVPSLSSQADTEHWSLVVSVLYSWLSFVCGMWLTALGSFFGLCLATFPANHPEPVRSVGTFSSVWGHDLGSSCSSHPHLFVQSLHCKESFCSVCTSDHSYHLNPVKWVKVSIGCAVGKSVWRRGSSRNMLL